MGKQKLHGWKEGKLSKDLFTAFGTSLKKGQTVRYKKFKSVPDKDGFRFSEYEYHYVDTDNQNLIRCTRLIIDGETYIDQREIFVNNNYKNENAK